MAHPHKTKKLRAKLDRARAESRALRAALDADRALWSHLLFCPDCQLQTVLRLLCPDALALRHAARKPVPAKKKH